MGFNLCLAALPSQSQKPENSYIAELLHRAVRRGKCISHPHFIFYEAHSRFSRFAGPIEQFGRFGPNAGFHAASQHHDEHQLIKNDNPHRSDASHQGDCEIEHDEQPGGHDQVEHDDQRLGHHQQVEHDDNALGHDQVEFLNVDQHQNEG